MKTIWVFAGMLALIAGCAEAPTAAPASTSQLGAGPAPQSAHGAAVAAGLGYHGPVDHSDRNVGD